MVTHIGTRTITTSDCLFVRNENDRVVLFASTYNQPEHRLHSKRYKNITPAKRQEFEMSLESSTPLSQNPEGNTAAAISDVNDNSIIADTENKSTIQKMVAAEITYGFVHNGKIYMNAEIMNHEPFRKWKVIQVK